MLMHQNATFISCAMVMLLSLVSTTHADEFVLRTGGQLSGDLLNRDQNPRTVYQVSTAIGVVELKAELVKEVLGPPERERQYAELLTRMPKTVEGHWKMSQWCQKSFLEGHRRRHLEACLEMDPNHEDARRALGFTLQDGQWMLADVLNRRMGMIRYNSRWQLPAEIVLARAADEREQEEKRLAQQLRLWRTWYVKGKNPAEAKRQFLGLRTYAAIAPLSRLLKEEDSIELKRILIQAFRNIGAESGSLALINEALSTSSETIRSDCLDGLREMGRLRAIAAFTAKLTDKHPSVINVAAIGLAAMDAQDSIPQLIDSLVTQHKIRISKGSPGSINPTFSNSGGGLGGLSMGGGGPKEIDQTVQNHRVQEALVAMTGVNFGFNEDAWKNWLVQSSRPQNHQLRRSE